MCECDSFLNSNTFLFQLVLLCEGKRFTEEKHKVCLKVAKEKGLPHLKHHLLPRPKGFTVSLQALKGKGKVKGITVSGAKWYM